MPISSVKQLSVEPPPPVVVVVVIVPPVAVVPPEVDVLPEPPPPDPEVTTMDPHPLEAASAAVMLDAARAERRRARRRGTAFIEPGAPNTPPFVKRDPLPSRRWHLGRGRRRTDRGAATVRTWTVAGVVEWSSP